MTLIEVARWIMMCTTMALRGSAKGASVQTQDHGNEGGGGGGGRAGAGTGNLLPRVLHEQRVLRNNSESLATPKADRKAPPRAVHSLHA